jgi:hypothetical protein
MLRNSLCREAASPGKVWIKRVNLSHGGRESATALGALLLSCCLRELLSLLSRVCEKDVFEGFYEKAKSLTNSNIVRIGIIYDDD